jgi:Heparinase II/III-like protein/Heparinase II/III N-terminus
MPNPLDKFKKLKGRSWGELRTRSGQIFSAYAERAGFGGKLPSDEEFIEFFDQSQFENNLSTAQKIHEKFYINSQNSFFPSFREIKKTCGFFKTVFGESAEIFVEKAERIIEGKFDLLGYENLDFGSKVDWHYEPIAGKISPRKHWKQFDELDATETGDKKIIWELNRHQHFFTLGIAFQLSGDEKYAAVFVRQLENWIEENPPGMGINWASSLEVAFRAISWIWALNFFKSSTSVTPEVFFKALKFLHLHGQHIEKYLSTYYSPNTHLTGEALGLYYLGTQLPFFKRAEHWRKLGDEILMQELDRQFLPDGVYFEQTTWYQRYTTDFYTHFLLLKSLHEGEKSPEKLTLKLQSALDFMMYITRPDGTTPIIGDDDGGRMLPLANVESNDFRGALAVGAVVFNRADYKFVAEEISEEIVWLLGKQGLEIFQNIIAQKPPKKSVSFENGGYYILRDGWERSDNYLLIDCGEIGSLTGGHGHADTLSFDLAVHGKTLLVDSGTYSYHESEKTRQYFRSAEAHNSLMIDGLSSSETGNKFNWKTKADARAKSWISQERFDFFEGAHDGYKNLAADYERSFLFLKNDYWIIRDCVKTLGEHEYTLNFHFDSNAHPVIKRAPDGSSCIGANDSIYAESWRFFTFGDNGDWQQKNAPISTHYGRKTESPFFQFVSKGSGTQEFFTFILPSEDGLQSPEVLENEISGGRAFIIKYFNYSDLFIFADADEHLVRTELFNSDFRFLWARLTTEDQIPEEFVMIDGKRFSIGKREVINHPKNLEFAVARRVGNKLNVKTNEGIFSVSLPQKKNSTFVLKN